MILPSFIEVARLPAGDEWAVRTWFDGFRAGRIGSPRRDHVWAWLDGNELELTIPDEPIAEAL